MLEVLFGVGCMVLLYRLYILLYRSVVIMCLLNFVGFDLWVCGFDLVFVDLDVLCMFCLCGLL